jgi:hypothetical protein
LVIIARLYRYRVEPALLAGNAPMLVGIEQSIEEATAKKLKVPSSKRGF